MDLLLGHLWGDYVFQPKWMALNKQRNDFLGWMTCILHCIIYTFCIMTLTWTWTLPWFILLFLSHFIIDKFNVVLWWLRFVGCRNIKDKVDRPLDFSSIEVSFATIVYVVVDNTFHLTIMYYGGKLLGVSV